MVVFGEKHMDENQTLKKLQRRQLSILIDVAEAMEKMNIKYYLSAGTLLGAVRHKGFIPWDDDIDIMVTRADYDRFVKKGKKYLPGYLSIYHYSKIPPWKKKKYQEKVTNTIIGAQVVDKRYKVTRMYCGKEQIQNIWIDIAALDEVPDGRMKELWYKARLKTLHTLIKIRRLDYKAVR